MKKDKKSKNVSSNMQLVLAPGASDPSEGMVYVDAARRKSPAETVGDVELDQGEKIEYRVYSEKQPGEGFLSVAPGCGDISEGMVWISVKRKVEK